jgi:hypothetical protein
MEPGSYRIYSLDLSWYRIVEIFPTLACTIKYSNADRNAIPKLYNPVQTAKLIEGWHRCQLLIERQ